jgi:hypothetical protein
LGDPPWAVNWHAPRVLAAGRSRSEPSEERGSAAGLQTGSGRAAREVTARPGQPSQRCHRWVVRSGAAATLRSAERERERSSRKRTEDTKQ